MRRLKVLCEYPGAILGAQDEDGLDGEKGHSRRHDCGLWLSKTPMLACTLNSWMEVPLQMPAMPPTCDGGMSAQRLAGSEFSTVCMVVSNWSISRISTTLRVWKRGRVRHPANPLPLIFSINLPKSTAAPKDKVTSWTTKPVIHHPPCRHHGGREIRSRRPLAALHATTRKPTRPPAPATADSPSRPRVPSSISRRLRGATRMGSPAMYHRH